MFSLQQEGIMDSPRTQTDVELEDTTKSGFGAPTPHEPLPGVDQADGTIDGASEDSEKVALDAENEGDAEIRAEQTEETLAAEDRTDADEDITDEEDEEEADPDSDKDKA
jgi:hypothetical protein